MAEFVSNSITDTRLIAQKFAKTLKCGDVVCMTGDLGAGKTAFVSAVANSLDIDDDIVSPTFNILLQYKSNNSITLNHFDLYRLESEEDLDDIGFYEIIDGNGISFIEWSEKFPNAMPENAKYINIEKIDENSRRISF